MRKYGKARFEWSIKSNTIKLIVILLVILIIDIKDFYAIKKSMNESGLITYTYDLKILSRNDDRDDYTININDNYLSYLNGKTTLVLKLLRYFESYKEMLMVMLAIEILITTTYMNIFVLRAITRLYLKENYKLIYYELIVMRIIILLLCDIFISSVMTAFWDFIIMLIFAVIIIPILVLIKKESFVEIYDSNGMDLGERKMRRYAEVFSNKNLTFEKLKEDIEQIDNDMPVKFIDDDNPIRKG